MDRRRIRILKKFFIQLIIFTMVLTILPVKQNAESSQTQQKTEESASIPEPKELQESKVTNKPKEVEELRTENTKIFDNQNGTYTKKIYQAPIHIKKTGKWEEISTELEEVPSKGLISPKNTELEISYLKKIKDGNYAQLKRDGHEITYKLLEAKGEQQNVKVNEVKAEIEKNKIFYKQIFPHIDLRGSIFNNSVKEDLILQQYTGHNIFQYELQTDLVPEIKENGSIVFYNQDKKEVIVFPKPFMVDSNVNQELGEAARSEDVTYTINKITERKYLITLTVNQEWLKDPKRVYPVYIDPSATTNWWDDAYISDRYPNQNYSGTNLWDPNIGYYSMKVGYYDGTTGTNWAFLKTDMSPFKGAIIHDAKLKVYVAHHYYANNPNGLWLDVVSGDWNPSTITWNNKPGSFPNPNTSVVNVTRNQWAEFNITQTVQNWANNSWGNYGFKLHTNGNGNTYWKKIVASEDYENPPVIEVTYSFPKPQQPRITSYSNGIDSGTGYVDLSWDPVPGAKEYQIAVYNGREYQYFWAGTGTSWSTKGKNIWPKEEEIKNGEYNLHTDGQGAEFPVYPAQTYGNAGGDSNFNGYKFKLKVGYEAYQGSESDETTVYIPLEQMQKPFGSAYTNVAGNNGYISLGWNPVPGAAGYKIWIFNGKEYEAYDVGNVTTWTTQNQNIWPTESEISQGRYQLHHDKEGTEFSTDPSPVYRNSGGPFGSNKNYWFNITAYSTNGHPESKISDPFEPVFTTESLLGVQKYWASVPVIGGSVTAFNGNFVLGEADIQLDGRGPGVSINRSYNSQDTSIGLFGKGWFSSIEEKVNEDTNGNIILTDEDKGTILFTKISNNQYQAPNGVYLEVKKTSNGFEIKDKDQSITFFSLEGKKQYEKDSYGNQVTYTYDTTGKLKSIKDASSREVLFEYTGVNVSKITGPENRVVKYEYNGDYLSASITPQEKKYGYGYENGKLRYTYDPKHTDTNPSKTTYTYEGNKLVQVIDPLGKETKLAYNDIAKEVTVTNPKGVKEVYGYTSAGNPLKAVMDADGLKLTTTYEYQANNLTKKTHPKDQGIRVSETYTYDGKGNVTSSQDVVGKEAYEYNGTNDLTKATDAEGKQTSITYNANSDAISTIHQQAKTASVTQYDAVGNLTAGSAALAPGANLLTNASFEDTPINGIPSWDGVLVNNQGDNTTYSLSPIRSAPGLGGGKQALQLGVKPTKNEWGVAIALQTISAKPNQTYTLSGWMKTQDVSNNSQAFMLVTLLNAKMEPTYITDRFMTGTQDWTRRQISFQTLSDTTQIRVELSLSHDNMAGTGFAWFDNVQLEGGSVSTPFNPVTNSSFERLENGNGPPVGWNRSSVNPGQVDEGFQGNNGVILKRNSVTDADQHYLQIVDVNQTEAKDLTVTAMSKADNVKNVDGLQEETQYGIFVYADYADGSEKFFPMTFPMGTKDWNRRAITVPADKPITKIWVYLIFRGNNTGTVWYDDIRILEGKVLTKQEYNTNGYVTAAYDEKGQKTSFTYDAYGNKKTETDPMNNTKLYEYNLDNQHTKTTLPNGTSVDYKYDDNNNVTEKVITDGTNTQTVKYEYDVDNKLTVFQDALLRKTTNTYDDNSNLISKKMPTGSLLEWTFDAADRVTQAKRNGQVAFSYEYDANGNTTKVIDSINGNTRDNVYDVGNRITSTTDRSGTVAWSYYQNSNKLKETKITQGAYNNTTNYEYDVLNQNTKVIDGGKSYYFEYDEFGDVARFQSGNDTFSLFSYDNTQKVTGLYIGTKNSTPILSEQYQYDSNGNRKIIERTVGSTKQTTSYEYDSTNQLKKETLADRTIKEYSYDGFGNRKSVKVTSPTGTITTTAAQFNSGNQLTKFGSETLTYDVNGNRTSDGKYLYAWNESNQLVAITKKGEGTHFATYKYDDAGRRIEKNVNGQITRYYYDGDSINVLYETDSNGNVLRQYVYGVNGIRLAMKSQGQTLYYHYNPHGDVIAMTDQSGNVVAKYDYDAWGNVLKSEVQGLTTDNPFGYAGYMYDKETGMYYLMARYYHPTHGVFLSADPDPGDTEDPITQNGYAYASNNPVMMIDPDGNIAFFLPVLWVATEALLLTAAVYAGVQVDKAISKKFDHGNSKKSKKPQHGYEIYDTYDNDIVKVGISGQKLLKNGESPRANQQVRDWNKKEKTPGRYQAKVVINGLQNRAVALAWEAGHTIYRKTQGNTLSHHKKPLAVDIWHFR